MITHVKYTGNLNQFWSQKAYNFLPPDQLVIQPVCHLTCHKRSQPNYEAWLDPSFIQPHSSSNAYVFLVCLLTENSTWTKSRRESAQLRHLQQWAAARSIRTRHLKRQRPNQWHTGPLAITYNFHYLQLQSEFGALRSTNSNGSSNSEHINKYKNYRKKQNQVS